MQLTEKTAGRVDGGTTLVRVGEVNASATAEDGVSMLQTVRVQGKTAREATVL
jgi:hypothetical protein